MIDRFSRWPEAVPLTNITADTIAMAFWTHWISVLDHPKQSLLIKARSLNLQEVAQILQIVLDVQQWHAVASTITNCATWPSYLLQRRHKSSAAEMLYGVPIRLPNEFFANMDETVDPTTFLSSFREHMQKIRPTPTSHHIKEKMFLLKELTMHTRLSDTVTQ
ncbi:uncharacterized protein LOC122612447 [Drosophila teissieri]|uniref:uncharacterized protein LOC122612447 n=1 Tax=Drosophila teissieri TaxID=7243 RepID=UPI001CBA23E4|nr:uncharacterized protein LOC122612447 [Drosophila teissieri]